MTFLHESDSAFSKRVLLIDPDTPGIDGLKWGDLIERMPVRAIGDTRESNHSVEFRVVPKALFSALFADLMVQHGSAVALSCLRVREGVQTLVYTKIAFGKVVAVFAEEVERNLETLNYQLEDLRELVTYLHVLSCTAPE